MKWYEERKQMHLHHGHHKIEDQERQNYSKRGVSCSKAAKPCPNCGCLKILEGSGPRRCSRCRQKVAA